MHRQPESALTRIIRKDLSKQPKGIFTYAIEKMDSLMETELKDKTSVKESEFTLIFHRCENEYIKNIPEDLRHLHIKTDISLRILHPKFSS